MKNLTKICLLFMFWSLLCAPIWATDKEAQEKIDEGIQADIDQEHYKAAQLFMDAELLADSGELKAKAIIAAASAYRHAKWYYKEFLALESLLQAFPNYIDFAKTIERQYEIGNLYYSNYREPIAKWLDWTAWRGNDHTLEIYEASLKHGPFSPHAPETKLRVARMYVIEGGLEKVNKGLELLRELISNHPNSPQKRFAQLELANVLYQKAIRGDGDEAYANEARDTLNAYIAQSNGDPEISWAKNMLQKLDENSAKKELSTAKFYDREGNNMGTSRSAQQVMDRYPATHAAKEASDILSEVQPTRVHPLPEAPPPRQSVIFPESPIQEQKNILTTPTRSSKYLRPVEDYSWELGKTPDEREALRNRVDSSIMER